MDKRLIFRYRSRTIQSQVCAGRATSSAVLEILRLTVQMPHLRVACRGRGKPVKGNSTYACLQEKHAWGCRERPYRKPTQVGKETSPEVNERPSVKELGKLTPYLRKKGDPSSFLLS